RIETIRSRYEFDDARALAVLAVVGLYEQTFESLVEAAHDGHAPPAAPDDETDPDARRRVAHAALEALADPLVAAAALDQMGVHDDQGAAALGVFAETAEPLAPRAAHPALHWMRAKALEAVGDCERAEAVLHAAESLDPWWPPTLLSLARYAGDRGYAARGLALLRRAGAPEDDELVQLLQRFGPAPGVGPNRHEGC
ncbi:MAG: hypothetical protein PHQ28_08200, partial [Mycobacterium sp.]|nr:hypothetical protein [Mycobacterium sp.]